MKEKQAIVELAGILKDMECWINRIDGRNRLSGVASYYENRINEAIKHITPTQPDTSMHTMD